MKSETDVFLFKLYMLDTLKDNFKQSHLQLSNKSM
jgi:hypothetical protein